VAPRSSHSRCFAGEAEVRNSALNRNIKSPAQSEVFGRTIGKVAELWVTVSDEEKRARARKSAQARWSRQRKISHLRRNFVIGGLFAQFARLSSAGAIENADRLVFELDSELLNDMVPRFCAGWSGNDAVILASCEFVEEFPRRGNLKRGETSSGTSNGRNRRRVPILQCVQTRC
jgi:hypothetical protein